MVREIMYLKQEILLFVYPLTCSSGGIELLSLRFRILLRNLR